MVLALVGDSTITNFPVRAFRFFTAFGAGGGGVNPAWASVEPILWIFDPQTEHVPEVVGLLLDMNPAVGFAISRLDLHLRQYPSIYLEAPVSQ